MTTAARNVRVGIFLTIAIAALFVVVFLLGAKQSLFHRKVHLRAAFENTSGLVTGTAVRLAGVDVGVVEKISFDPDLRVRKVHVVLGVSSAYQDRVRTDSIARLASKGLLGDMVVDISVGSAGAARLNDGDELPTQETEGLTEVVRSVQDAIGEVRMLSKVTTGRVEALLSDRVVADVSRALRSIADVSDEAAHGHGAVHALLHDPQLGDELLSFGASARRAGASAASAMTRVDALLAEDGVKKLPTDLARAAQGIADVVTQLKSGDGLAHTLLYDPDRSRLMENLSALSTTLRAVSDEVSQGKGTVGALLKDPTVYQDLKLLLGNVRRSRMLRALVRYTISHDGLRATALPTR
jgi:phospholipid/cholesterol/gamma-HCH transport system substrate-binding protein